MLTLESGRRTWGALPLLARLGLLGIAVGGLADVVAHVGAGSQVGHLHEHTSAEFAAHLVVFVGMVLVLLGVVVDGARRTRPGRWAEGPPGRESRDAIR